MLLCEFMEFSDQVCLLLWLFVELLMNKSYNIIKWSEKSKKLHNHMILVYKHHIKNSSDFDKLLLHIHHKAIHGTHSPT
jgi:hypothetical protein